MRFRNAHPVLASILILLVIVGCSDNDDNPPKIQHVHIGAQASTQAPPNNTAPGRQSDHPQRIGGKMSKVVEETKQAGATVWEKTKETTGQVVDATKSAVHKVAEATGQTVDTVKQKAAAAYDAVKEKTGQAIDAAKQKMGGDPAKQ